MRRMALLAPDDSASMSDATSYAGADTRQWGSYGIVQPNGGTNSVRFNDDDGNPLPQGVLVDVKLMPSGHIVPCRVGGHAAGNGEGEYNPFGPGDEVYVMIPEGNERAGCVIISRFNNSADVWPTKVAAQDATKNNFAFRRQIVPYIFETVSSYMVRSASTNANFSIDPIGNVLLADGSQNFLSLSHTSILLQESTGQALLQIDPDKLQIALQSGGGTQLLLDKSLSHFLTPGSFTILTSGADIAGHGITAEQVIVLIEGFMSAFALILAPIATPLTGTALAALITPALLPVMMAAGIPIAAELPLTVEKAALEGALQIPPDPSGTVPGVGRVGFLY